MNNDLQTPVQSSAPKVFGVLSIIFASLTLVLSALGGLTTSAMRGSALGAMATVGTAGQAMVRYQEAIRVPTYVNMAILIAMSITLLVLGVGQVGYRRWAASLTVGWGALALLALGGMIALSVIVITPAKDALFAELARGIGGGAEAMIQRAVFSSMGGSWMAYLSLLIYAPYPLLLLFFFARTKVRESMTR